MTAKKTTVNQTGYQIPENAFDSETPLLARALVHALIAHVDALDFNKDGIADVSQLEPFAVKMLPKLQSLLAFVDATKFSGWIESQSWFNNTPESAAILADIEAVAKEAFTLAAAGAVVAGS